MKRNLALPIIILLFYAASVCLNVSFRQHLLVPRAEADIIQRMFGSFRIFVGDWAFIKAEEYHHRGLPFEQALAYHEGESIFTEREQHEEDHEHDAEPAPYLGPFDAVRRCLGRGRKGKISRAV